MSLNRIKAVDCIINSEYYKIPEIISIRETEGDLLSMLGKAFFFMGRFEQAFETYQRFYYSKDVLRYRLGDKTPEEFDGFGNVIINILEDSGAKEIMDELPSYMDYDYKQSVEGSDEQYEEFREYRKLIKKCLESAEGNYAVADNMFRDKLRIMRESKDIKQVSKSYFFDAELCYGNENYERAFGFYLNAAKVEVSKALYYGYAGNMLFKVAHKEKKNADLRPLIPASILTYRAIDLDYNNAKWHFNEGLILKQLALLFGKDNNRDLSLIKSALNEFRIAQKVLRDDQEQLRFEIERQLQWLGNIK